MTITTRTEQREQTRDRIVDAAVAAFAADGFEATSTRDIAARAGVTQGLVTYHFASKDDLWRAAADRIFGRLGAEVPAAPGSARTLGARGALAAFVGFSARNPELFRFMVDAGRHDDERMRWLVESHLAPRFAAVEGLAAARFGRGGALSPHLYYAVVGASSLMFAVAPECEVLTGVDPSTDAAIERHVDLVVSLFLSAPTEESAHG